MARPAEPSATKPSPSAMATDWATPGVLKTVRRCRCWSGRRGRAEPTWASVSRSAVGAGVQRQAAAVGRHVEGRDGRRRADQRQAAAVVLDDLDAGILLEVSPSGPPT